MQSLKYNTDMADERVDEYKVINNMSSIDGIDIDIKKYEEFSITTVNVTNENGERAIDKKQGKYITFEIEDLKYIEDRSKIIQKLHECILDIINTNESVMVVGLGNIQVTADALGSNVASNIEVTRHILKLSRNLIDSNIREVSAIVPGVMGNTGIESSSIIQMVANNIKPKYIIVIDSLMSKSMKRVGSSIQISNTGIIPGSGISGHNSVIDENTTGAKIISIGVPMVVDIATIVNETIAKIENREESNEEYKKVASVLNTDNFIVTPKDIDELIKITSDIITQSINISL